MYDLVQAGRSKFCKIPFEVCCYKLHLHTCNPSQIFEIIITLITMNNFLAVYIHAQVTQIEFF